LKTFTTSFSIGIDIEKHIQKETSSDTAIVSARG